MWCCGSKDTRSGIILLLGDALFATRRDAFHKLLQHNLESKAVGAQALGRGGENDTPMKLGLLTPAKQFSAITLNRFRWETKKSMTL